MPDKNSSYAFWYGDKKLFGIGSWESMGLKKPVLYVCSDTENAVVKVASFNNWEGAELFVKMMKKGFGVKEGGTGWLNGKK